MLELLGFDTEYVRTCDTPFDTSTAPNDDMPLAALAAQTYRQGCGMIQWMVTAWRQDLSFVANYLGCAMSKPTVGDLRLLHRAARYIAGTRDHGLAYHRHKGVFDLETYTDSDYAAHESRRLQVCLSSWVILLFRGPLSGNR